MSEKTVSGYLVYNYFQDDVRYRKSKPSKDKISPYEIQIEVEFDVKIPELSIPKISKTIEIPEVQIREAVAEFNVEPDSLESDFPDPEFFLAQNSAEEIEEELSDMGFDSSLEVERDDVVRWLRELHKKEYERFSRDAVLSSIEKAVFEVRSGGDN